MDKWYFTKFAIDLTNKCQSKCEFCPRYSLPETRNPLGELKLEVFKKIFDKEYIMNIKNILYNGSLGEPTLSKHIFEITDYIAETNPEIILWMSTNGSTRNEEWWAELAEKFSFNKNNAVRFAIDGLEDTHSIYRRGTNYSKIIKNLRAFTGAGGKAEWQFLLFKHNEHQVNRARVLSIAYGCSTFIVLNSRGYDEKFEKPTQTDLKTKREMCSEQTQELYCTPIEERCLYLSHEGKIYPCCDYALYKHFLKVGYLEAPAKMYIEYLKSIKSIDMNHSSLDDAISSPFFQYIIKNRYDLKYCNQECRVYGSNHSSSLMQVYKK
jgi:MoaA/NifB/PqqE/SkfB family radical SAM enzyme